MLIYLNAALVSWQTVNRRFPDASRLGSLVAAFVGIVIWVFGRKRKARFEANARIPLTCRLRPYLRPKTCVRSRHETPIRKLIIGSMLALSTAVPASAQQTSAADPVIFLNQAWSQEDRQ